MRRAAKKDLTHSEIVEGLRAAGIVVFDVSGTNCGFDIVCYKSASGITFQKGDEISFAPHGVIRNGNIVTFWQPLEIKTPAKQRGKKATLTKSEQKAQRLAPIPVVESLEEALRYF